MRGIRINHKDTETQSGQTFFNTEGLSVFFTFLGKLFVSVLYPLCLCLFVVNPLLSEVVQVDSVVDKQFQEANTKYLKLRNTDPEILKKEEWLEVLKNFERLEKSSPDHIKSSSIVFNSALISHELYRIHGESEYLDRALESLKRFVKKYPDSTQADDALYRKAEWNLIYKEDRETAEKLYQRIISVYPDSDMVDAARMQLMMLGGAEAPEEAPEEAQETEVAAVGAPVIVIDPGHGGEDLGAVGVGGLYEKDVTLAIAFKLKKILQDKLGAVVRLTRSRDQFVPLAVRTSMANDYEAELFISLHVNATFSHEASGLEVYYLNTANDEASKKLAERENAVTRFEGVDADLQYMLSDFIQGAKLDDSRKLAAEMNQELHTYMKNSWSEVKSSGVKKAMFYVLVGAYMPCVLVETFFIDHATDGKRLGLPEFRDDISHGLYKGIRGYLEKKGWQFK